MDQQKRMVMFLVLSFGTMFLWLRIGLPFFYPEMLERQAARQAAREQQQQAQQNEQKAAEEAGETRPTPAAEAAPGTTPETAATPEPETPTLPDFPARRITLGSMQVDSPHFFSIDLTSEGASVLNLQLNDPRYRELHDRALPLQLLGEVPGRALRTFDLKVSAIDALLQAEGTRLDQVHWEVDDASLTDHSVTFRYPSPDGKLEVFKTYALREGNPQQRDSDYRGYCLDLTVGFRNLSDRPLSLTYDLQGPVGFPLEEAENTRRFLMLQAGFNRSGSVRHEQVSALDIAKQADSKNGIDPLRAPIQFIGVDGQYFTTLLSPTENQEKFPWIEETQPLLMQRAQPAEHSLISLVLKSNRIELPAAGAAPVEQTFTLYAGPKRTPLLRPFSADSTIEYGWFGAVSKIMLAIMNFFHHTLYLPYGLAIVMLTVIVRGAMYPISRKHALAAKRMKEMQPRFEEIRKKYENDKEKLAKAQMELMKESGFFAGCLPMLLQLPIFIGLYQALYVSVDLRMAEFLWIDNLAAPDRLFQLPFSVWFIGNDFNLLPMITVALFIIQQKLFAPPPANEEQALQQKMMSYMMVIIGVMFYRVPAGLCVYFIASSLWAIAERKILDFHDTATDPARKSPQKPAGPAAGGGTVTTISPKKPSWLQNVLASLDAAANPANKGAQPKNDPGHKKPNHTKS